MTCAMLGVLHELWRTQAFSWLTLITALGYPPYFMLRRWMRLDALSGFVLEMLVLAPLAIWLIIAYGPVGRSAIVPLLWLLVPVMALIGTLAFAAYMASSRLLPLGAVRHSQLRRAGAVVRRGVTGAGRALRQRAMADLSTDLGSCAAGSAGTALGCCASSSARASGRVDTRRGDLRPHVGLLLHPIMHLQGAAVEAALVAQGQAAFHARGQQRDPAPSRCGTRLITTSSISPAV